MYFGRFAAMSSNLMISWCLLISICSSCGNDLGPRVTVAYRKYPCSKNDSRCLCSSTEAFCDGKRGKLSYIPKLPPGIIHLYFYNNSIPNLTNETFTNVSSLERLYFTKNELKTISQDAFSGLDKLQVLGLDSNKEINKTQLSSSFSSLRKSGNLRLYLRKIHLTELTKNIFVELAASNVVRLDLSENLIQVLNMAAFRHLTHLTDLILAKNRIQKMSSDTVIVSLSYLNLDNNFIGGEMTSFCHFKDETPLFPNLTRLNIQQNFIRVLQFDNFKCLNKLRILRLGNNELTVITDNVFGHMKQLKQLHLDHMKEGIQSIHPFAFNITSLVDLNIEGNNILFQQNKHSMMFSLCTNLRILSISYNDLKYMQSDKLTNMLRPLIQLERLSAISARIARVHTHFLDSFYNITFVNLRQNKLSTVEYFFHSARNINFFSLQGNKIRVLTNNKATRTFLSSVIQLNMADNPFSCTCENMWFRSIIDNTGKIEFGNASLVNWKTNYHCTTPKHMQYLAFQKYHPSDSSCISKNYFVIVTVPLTMVFIFCLFTTIIVYRYRWYVKYWLYKLKSKNRSTEQLPLLEPSYDAFVIYNTSDCDYVHQDFRLLLEMAHAYKLHLWERDVTSGHNNFQEMVAAIEASHSAIAIISKESLDDGWFQFQLSVALDRQVELKRAYLLLVILENVDCERLSKFWCVLLTRLPTARWCPEKTDVKRTVFEQQLCSHLRNRDGR